MKRTVCVLLPLLLTGCAASRVEEDRRALGAETLFWSQAERDANFPRMERLFPATVVAAGAKPRPLPAGDPLVIDAGEADAFFARHNVAGLLVLQDGRVRYERYARGLSPDRRWTSFSVAKSMTSTLVGAAIKDGHIRSLDDPVTRYLPELVGGGYDGVTVRQLLTMTSGVRWNEDYTDPQSDVARMLAVKAGPKDDVTLAYMAKLPRAAEPGTRWNYNTGETNLTGVLVRRATGKPLATYLSDKIWRPYGMDQDAAWLLDAGRAEIGGCCVSATLRDFARFGQFMLDGGRVAGQSILPADWIKNATSNQVTTGIPYIGYGYQWWTAPRGSYAAIGIFGQMVHIDPNRRLVIALASAWPEATGREQTAARTALVRRIGDLVDGKTGAR